MTLHRAHRALLACILALLAVPIVHADSMGAMRATLPEARTNAAAAHHGSSGYLFLGCCNHTDEVWKYSPSTDSLKVMQARLPGSVPINGAVASTPYGIFVFAINQGTYRYDPDTDSFDDMGVVVHGMTTTISIGNPGVPAAAFWDARSLPLTACPFGCVYVLVADGTIWRYDPAANRLNPAPVGQLPYSQTRERFGAALGWDGTHAYLFGGRDHVRGLSRFEYTDEVVRYNPVTNLAVVLDVRLPEPVAGSSVAGGQGSFWIYGGVNESRNSSASILEFNATRLEFHPLVTQLPRPLSSATVVRDDQIAYILGGYSPKACQHGYCPRYVPQKTILRHDPFRDNAPPVANIDLTVRTASSGWELIMDGRKSTDPDGDILFWDWSIGNETTLQGPSVSIAVEPNQTYVVRLSVTDDAYAANQSSRVIVPTELLPVDNGTQYPSDSEGQAPAVSTAGALLALIVWIAFDRRRIELSRREPRRSV